MSERVLIVPLAAQGHRSKANPLGYNDLGQRVMASGFAALDELIDQMEGRFDTLMLRSPCGVTPEDEKAPRRRLLSRRQEVVDPMGYPVFGRWSIMAMTTFHRFKEALAKRGIKLGIWVGLSTARDDGRRRRWMIWKTLESHIADLYMLAWMGFQVIGLDAPNWVTGKGGKSERLLGSYIAATRAIPAKVYAEAYDAKVAGWGSSDKTPLAEAMFNAEDPDATLWLLNGGFDDLPNPAPKRYAIALHHAVRLGLVADPMRKVA